ncbi:MAG: cytochrome c biogenesis protein/redoxin [Candidatus Ornithospirochaeta sp.]|nr:cytochrome c biogenesis protein CcdA [Sphaerochaetaceae bacterium]MDY5523869.1 cytochrome c biogenesis protein/redoxin [Candidatus Ornithospirochaeta sp.]
MIMVEGVGGIAAFIEGILSFFSPCVLPLLPLYLSYLSGGNVERNEEGDLIYNRGKVLINTLFFSLGISVTFFLLSFGTSALSRFLNTNSETLRLTGGVIIILFSLYQLLFYGTKYGFKGEARINIRAKGTGGALFSFLLGFTFSFSWTPCVGPVLASIIVMSTVEGGRVYLLVCYALGFIIPFLVVGAAATTLMKALKRHMKIVKYTVRISSLILLIIGIMMVGGVVKDRIERKEIEELIPDTIPISEEIIADVEERTEGKGMEAESHDESLLGEEERTGAKTNEAETLSDITEVKEEAQESFAGIGEGSEAESDSPMEKEEGREDSSLEENASSDSSSKIATEEERAPSFIETLDYSFIDQNGRLRRLSSLYGKVVFLNAFATWCGPCRYEMPDIEELYEKYKDSSEVVILGVAFPSRSDEGNASYIRSFLSDGGYTYPVLMDPKGILSSVFSIRAFPTTVVFGKDGEVVSYVPGALSGEYMEKLITDALEN